MFHRFFHHFSSRIFSTPASFRLIAFSPGHSFRLYSSRSRYLTLVQRLLHIPFAPLVTLLLPPPRTPSHHYCPPPPPPVSPLLSLAISQEASSMSRVRARPSLPPLVCASLRFTFFTEHQPGSDGVLLMLLVSLHDMHIASGLHDVSSACHTASQTFCRFS